jgi:VWFA-related protein
MKRQFSLLIAGALLLINASLADAEEPQTAAPPGTGSGFFTEIIDVRVINIDVFVTDRSGVPVAGLGPEAFELKVDGEPIPISNFYAEMGGLARQSVEVAEVSADPGFRPKEQVREEAPQRSYVVLLIDHSRLGTNNRKRAFAALRQALSRLGEEELVAVVGVEGSLKFYSDFLYDRQAIERILDDAERFPPTSRVMEAERRQIFGELNRGISGGIQAQASLADDQLLKSRIQAYAVQEHARSLSSLRQIEKVIRTLAGIPGRKSLLYLGEGIPTRPGEGLFVEWRNRFGSGDPTGNLGMVRTDYNTDYARTVGRYDLGPQISQLGLAANRAGVTIYAVDAEGDHGGIVRSALTEQGARSEAISVVNENYREPLESIAKATGGRLLRSSGQLADQLVNLLGDFDSFYSIGFTPPADWEPGSGHDIKVRVRGRNLVVRHRADVAVPKPDEREAGATVAALRYRTADNPLELTAVPGEAVPREDGNAVLPVALSVPIANLELLPRDGTHAGSLSIYVSTKDKEGSTTQVQKIPFNLAIPDAVIERARGDSARYELPLILRPGDLQVAVGIRDNISGRFSAVRLDVFQYSSRL